MALWRLSTPGILSGMRARRQTHSAEPTKRSTSPGPTRRTTLVLRCGPCCDPLTRGGWMPGAECQG